MLKPSDLAALFQVTKKTITVWHRAGEMPQPVIKSGNVVRWQKQTIRNWLERKERAAQYKQTGER